MATLISIKINISILHKSTKIHNGTCFLYNLGACPEYTQLFKLYQQYVSL